MLTKKEMQLEILLLKEKIKIYNKEIEPYLKLEEIIGEKIGKFGGSALNLNVTISNKASKVAMIKQWEKELSVYERILKGKKMEHLQEPRFVEEISNEVKKAIKQIQEI